MPRSNRRSRSFLAAISLLLASDVAAVRAAAEPPAPDLRLEWRGVEASGPVRGGEGEVATVAYRLRNVGAGDAFAAVVDVRTALGRAGGAARIQPGPAAGAALDRTLHVTLARGMSGVCIEAWVQPIEASEPGDPHPEDNRICRGVVIEPRVEARP